MRLEAAGGKPVLQESDSQHEPGAPGGADGSTQVLLKLQYQPNSLIQIVLGCGR